MSVKLLTVHHLEFLSLTAGCIGWYESTLVKMPHCWKSCVVAHLFSYISLQACCKLSEEVADDPLSISNKRRQKNINFFGGLKKMSNRGLLY